MIFTVTTARDSIENVRRWVKRNLSHGVDHMIVFLDAPAPAVRAFLDGHPNTTCIRTDESWWHGERPPALNMRQVINANAARLALARAGTAQWLFHIDADEVVILDREELAAMPEDVRAVRLLPMEAVSRWHWPGEVTHFKRLLDDDELALLKILGVIDKAQNNFYFNGHVTGKVGLRPDFEVLVGVHDARVVVDGKVTSHPDKPCRSSALLHYESVDGSEFVRKWTNMLSAGPDAAMRHQREPLKRAMRALLSKRLPVDEFESLATMVFERTRLDDLELLSRLRLLEELDVTAGSHQPRLVDDDAAAALTQAWQALLAFPEKRMLAPRHHAPGTAEAALGTASRGHRG